MEKSLFSTHIVKSTAVILLCSFLFCTSSEGAEVDRYRGELIRSTTSDPRSFNPIVAKETSTTMILAPMFEGLTTTDPFDLHVKPNLAERWESSADGLVWTFYLRDELRWSDGAPLTADDVVFTFNDLIFNDKVPNSARDIFTIRGKPIRVEKVNDLAVRFILPARFAPFLRSMGQEILPRHKLFEAVKADKFNFTWGIDTPVREIVGTGPFRMIRYIPGQQVVYEPNPFYWKKGPQNEPLPYLRRLVYMIVPSGDVELLKFLEGSIDEYTVRGMDYPFLKPYEKSRDFTIYDMGPDMGSNFIAFNQNTSLNTQSNKPFVAPHKLRWFTDIRFRRAVAHAVDKKRVIDVVKNGLGYPQHSPESPAVGFFYNDNVRKYDYDLEKSRQLLSEMGFQDRNRDGVLEDSAGNRLEFNLLVNADNTERVSIAGILRNDLESLGMKVNLQLVEFNTLVAKLTSNFEWDAIVLGLTGTIDPHFGQNVWLSNGQLHMWNPRQKTPATRWEERLDEIFAMGAEEMDEKKRKTYYDEFQSIIAEELPLIYTALSARMTAVRNKFENLKPTSYGGAFHNLEELYVVPEKR